MDLGQHESIVEFFHKLVSDTLRNQQVDASQHTESYLVNLLANYALNVLNIHKVTANCYANNLGSISAFKKCAFIQEGNLLSHCYCDNKYVDVVCLGKVKTEKK